METKKIVNLLNVSYKEHSKFAAKNGIFLIMNQTAIIHTKSNKIFNEFIRIKSL